jgi:ribonuclease HI
VAEIQAAIVAVRQAVTAGRTHLLIHTDSQFLINCVTQWMAGWKVGPS